MEPTGKQPRLMSDDLQRLAAELGAGRAAALGPLIERLQAIGGELEAWLAEAPLNRERFTADPAGILTERFPNLDIPPDFRREPEPAVAAGLRERLGPRLSAPTAGATPEALDLFEAFWVWVTVSDANAASYQADAFAALRGFAAGRNASAAVVDELVRGLERVRGIVTLALDQPFAWFADPTIQRPLR